MQKFNIGDRVIVIDGNEIARGTIKNVHFELNIFIVEFDDGSVNKVALDKIALESKAETTTEPEDKETREDASRMKSEITITPDEFKRVAIEVLSEVTAHGEGNIFENFAFGMKVIPILTSISARLFLEDDSESSDENVTSRG